MRRFKVGDKVRIARSPDQSRIGLTAQITQFTSFVETSGSRWIGIIKKGTEMCVLDLQAPVPGFFVAYPHDYLEPVYDGNEKVAWSACIWQPQGVKV